jgi:hypothetical protein
MSSAQAVNVITPSEGTTNADSIKHFVVDSTQSNWAKHDVVMWTGSEFRILPQDTSLLFVFNTFVDNQATPQLIGSGVWQAAASIIFTCTYDNPPPDSMLVWLSGATGWTGSYFSFDNADKTADTTSEATNYPSAPNNVVTFYGTAHADDDSTTKTTTVTFPNDTRWDVSTAGILNDANVNALSNSDLDEDKTQNFGALNPGASEHICLAYPDRLGTLGSTVFRFLGMTAGFSLQDLNPHVNSASYSENYNVYKSILANMGSSTFYTTGSLLNQVRYKGTATGSYDSAFIEGLTSTDIDNDQTQTATASGWSVVMGVTDYSFIAVPSRWSLNASYFRYLTGGAELQAGFTEVGSDIAWQNPAGYSETWDIWKSDVQDLGDGSIGVGQSAIRQRFYYGNSTTGSSFSEANIEALPSNSIRQDTDNTQTWGAFDPANYVALAVPARCAALQHGTDYETDGNQGTAFRFDGLTAAFAAAEVVSVTNEYGFTENYEVYASTIQNPGSGSGTFITTTTQTVAYQYWGIHTDVSASGWSLSDFTTMSGQGGGSTTTSTDVTGDPQFTVTAGVGEYIWFCYPKRLGTVTFWVGGFEGGFEAAETVSLTNMNGWTEDYYCWRSTQANLGVTAVKTT